MLIVELLFLLSTLRPDEHLSQRSLEKCWLATYLPGRYSTYLATYLATLLKVHTLGHAQVALAGDGRDHTYLRWVKYLGTYLA